MVINIYNVRSDISTGKGEIVPVLFPTDHHGMKVYWGRGGIAPRIR
jgi:hypothetical protein